ncbi:hypothetical protein DSM106972_018870 [Dulcicalothrix desertica PCC 7102]|uniref:Uncharacterized protein n=1 Tax=Dulcicalothrix desertica PCC 7102 TaxID=232991 RepID=A0A433VNG3_9CYAN|nr:hypothetical protein [Dulcicalothrix desertica]RUT07627.1 hypothetical protein DSM106972_018870 [Dulcicalothrix desertica PCC 7102]TWH39796.1 hypothetical protein CAL7102_09057 [Dulcicalothrix desertica PCC 7102]
MSRFFRLRQDAESWFSNIMHKQPIDTKFDIYYFCLMLGLATGKYNNTKDGSEFVDYFVKDYASHQTLIIGLLIRAELFKRGIHITERDEVSNLFKKFIDTATRTQLSDEAIEKLNGYASGGYEYLAGEIDTKPHHVEEFLITYHNLLNEAIENNPQWLSRV